MCQPNSLEKICAFDFFEQYKVVRTTSKNKDDFVGNEICSGTECENFKPGTTGTESIRTDKKDTTDNTTMYSNNSTTR